MSSAAGLSWSQDPSLTNSSDTPSPIFPDRPIRPLPKRRLRSRLSDEQADAIIYPPIPPSSSPLYGSPQSQSDRSFTVPHYPNDAKVLRDEHEHVCNCGVDHSEAESEDEEEPRESPEHRYSWPDKMIRYPRQYLERVTNRAKPPPPNSSTSSGDGYESFENTNNKKKRKIPIPGTATSVLSYDGTGVGVPSQSVDVSVPDDHSGSDATHYNSATSPYSGGSGAGISGAGRGRLSKSNGRPFSERKHTSNATDAVNGFANGSVDPSPNHMGLIGKALASAAEKGSLPSSRTSETADVLTKQSQQQPAKSKDFTFECKSDSSNKMSLSAQSAPRGLSTTGVTPFTPLRHSMAQGTQTNTGHTISSEQANVTLSQQQQQMQLQQQQQPHQPQQQQQPQQTVPAKKTKPRRPGHTLLMAAQRRRDDRMYENHCNPPKKEDVWICEFCEYESIFGVQPVALVRQYEIKDRRERKRIEEKRRLLEKAKAKGRKNKKGAKGSARNNASGLGNPQNQSTSQRQDPQYDPNVDQDSQGEEYFEDGYDDNSPDRNEANTTQFQESPWTNKTDLQYLDSGNSEAGLNHHSF